MLKQLLILTLFLSVQSAFALESCEQMSGLNPLGVIKRVEKKYAKNLLEKQNHSVIKLWDEGASILAEMTLIHNMSCDDSVQILGDFEIYEDFSFLGLSPIKNLSFDPSLSQLGAEIKMNYGFVSVDTPVAVTLEALRANSCQGFVITEGDLKGAFGAVKILELGSERCLYYLQGELPEAYERNLTGLGALKTLVNSFGTEAVKIFLNSL